MENLNLMDVEELDSSALQKIEGGMAGAVIAGIAIGIFIGYAMGLQAGKIVAEK
jgi:hypothetical protein